VGVKTRSSAPQWLESYQQYINFTFFVAGSALPICSICGACAQRWGSGIAGCFHGFKNRRSFHIRHSSSSSAFVPFCLARTRQVCSTRPMLHTSSICCVTQSQRLGSRGASHSACPLGFFTLQPLLGDRQRHIRHSPRHGRQHVHSSAALHLPAQSTRPHDVH
jgi:hypothetical protein